MSETELVQIYCRDGKRKTTATVGTAVRAAEWGYRVLVAKLLKTDGLEEITRFSHAPDVTVLPCGRNFGFSWNMTQAQRKAVTLCYNHCLLNAWNMALGTDGEEPYDMLMPGEAIGARNLGFIDKADLVKASRGKPVVLKVILTGRCPSEALRDQTGYITEMAMRRHPYERGVEAKGGIEYQKIDTREYVLVFQE